MNDTDTNMIQSLRDAADHLVNRVRELTTERDDLISRLTELEHAMPRELARLEREHADAIKGWENKWKAAINMAARAEIDCEDAQAALKQAHKDFGCELRDPNGTIWEHAAKLQKQVDSLLPALRLGFNAVAELIDLHHVTAPRDRDVAWHNRAVRLDAAYRDIRIALGEGEP
jgi:DNA repair exonuclease SbcCD ATPase subunit